MRRLAQETLPIAFTGAAAVALTAVVSLASFPPAERVAPLNATAASRIPDAEIAAGVSLTHILRPERTLVSKVVQTTMGEEVGRIAAVALDADGEPAMVTISLAKTLGASRASARIAADNLLYLPKRDALVTRFTEAETASLIRNGE